MSDLGERFLKVNKLMMKSQNLTDKELKLRTEFEQAIHYLKPGVQLMWIDDNICTFRGNVIVPLTKDCFDDGLSIKEKGKKHTVIKRYFQTTRQLDKMYCAKTPQPFIRYEKIIVYMSPDGDLCAGNIPASNMYEKKVPGGSFFGVNDVTEDAIRFLYGLTNGNIDCLLKMAKLCAYVLSQPLATKKPIVILADKAVHGMLVDFINVITQCRVTKVPLKDVIKNDSLAKLHKYNLNGCFANVTVNDQIPDSELEVQKLTSVFSGDTLRVKDSRFFGTVRFRNNIPFIYITDSHEQYLMMRNFYGAKEIKIPSKHEIPVPIDDLSVHWLCNEFAAFGLKCLKDKKLKDVSVSKIKEDDIFKSFMKDVCILSEEFVCPKRELYDAYEEYYKKYYGGEPLTRIMFGKKFAQFGNLETVRPRRKGEKYVYCFKGIAIRDDKLMDLTYTKEGEKYSTTYDEFDMRLRNLTESSVFANIRTI